MDAARRKELTPSIVADRMYNRFWDVYICGLGYDRSKEFRERASLPSFAEVLCNFDKCSVTCPHTGARALAPDSFWATNPGAEISRDLSQLRRGPSVHRREPLFTVRGVHYVDTAKAGSIFK
eukprot:4160587-Prymnesium_polylepis.1